MLGGIIISIVLLASLTPCTHKGQDGDAGQTPIVQHTRMDSHAAPAGPSVPTLPAFILQNTHGEAVNLQSFKGKKVFVNLWASWCPPCRREMPSIQKLFQSVDTGKVAFVLLSLDDDFDKAIKFVRNKRLSLPIYYPGEDLPALLRVPGIPVTFIFNERGELIRRIEGSDDYNTHNYRELLK